MLIIFQTSLYKSPFGVNIFGTISEIVSTTKVEGEAAQSQISFETWVFLHCTILAKQTRV
jgi:hypothetical protein